MGIGDFKIGVDVLITAAVTLTAAYAAHRRGVSDLQQRAASEWKSLTEVREKARADEMAEADRRVGRLIEEINQLKAGNAELVRLNLAAQALTAEQTAKILEQERRIHELMVQNAEQADKIERLEAINTQMLQRVAHLEEELKHHATRRDGD